MIVSHILNVAKWNIQVYLYSNLFAARAISLLHELRHLYQPITYPN